MKTLEVGEKAPLFECLNQNEELINSESFLGSKLILFFYPKDNTPGCTAEACNLSENFDLLTEKGFKLLGVSPDSPKRHVKFIEKFNFPFDLLADEDHKVMDLFGVWGLKKFMGREYDGVHRTTFIINEEGVIEHVIKKVKTKQHSEQILDLYK